MPKKTIKPLRLKKKPRAVATARGRTAQLEKMLSDLMSKYKKLNKDHLRLLRNYELRPYMYWGRIKEKDKEFFVSLDQIPVRRVDYLRQYETNSVTFISLGLLLICNRVYARILENAFKKQEKVIFRGFLCQITHCEVDPSWGGGNDLLYSIVLSPDPQTVHTEIDDKYVNLVGATDFEP